MTAIPQQTPTQPAEALRARVRATWTAGDFGRIAVGFETGAAAFIERLELAPGERLLDVACGTGNLTLPAARAGAHTTGIDIAPDLVAQLAARAAAEGLAVDAREGDAEALPFADGGFDTVVSMLYGAADFTGGLAARRAGTLPVIVLSQFSGLVLLLFLLPVLPAATPSRADLLWGVLAGLTGGVGVGLLYRALAIGRMSAPGSTPPASCRANTSSSSRRPRCASPARDLAWVPIPRGRARGARQAANTVTASRSRRPPAGSRAAGSDARPPTPPSGPGELRSPGSGPPIPPGDSSPHGSPGRTRARASRVSRTRLS